MISQAILSQMRLSSMEIMKQGQWYALMLNRDYTNALKYVELINKINLKENDPKNNVGWFV